MLRYPNAKVGVEGERGSFGGSEGKDYMWHLEELDQPKYLKENVRELWPLSQGPEGKPKLDYHHHLKYFSLLLCLN